MTTKEEIITAYELLPFEERRMFKIAVAEKFRKELGTMSNWWFSKSNYYAIPKHYQNRVLKLLNNREEWAETLSTSK